MYVLEVLPLTRGATLGTLSYRSATEAAPGTLLRIPIRKKETLGVVLASIPVAEAKASLKRATFALRGASFADAGRIPDAYMQAARELALTHATSDGAVLLALTSEYLTRGPLPFSSGAGFSDERIEDAYEKRVRAYESAVRKTAKRGASTLILAPTRVEAKRLANHFATYDPVVITGEEPVKRRAMLVERALASTLVIATPAFAWLPLHSLGLIVVERIGAGTYVRERHPYLDMRHAALAYARARDVMFIAGDLPLPIPWRPDAARGVRAMLRAGVDIIDARPNDDQKTARVPFRALPDAVIARLGKTLKKGGRVAILATRRGYSPSVICRDCGTSVKDAEGRTLSFVKSGDTPLFRSSDGKTARGADIHCANCGGWNLMPLGIGIERVAEEARAAFPAAPLVVFDASALRKKGAAERLIKKALEPGTILVGTEAMLTYLDPRMPVDEGVIASADSLLSLPFWNARERLVRLGLAFRERATHLTVLTRNPEDTASGAIAHAKDDAFWREEVRLRERFSYPPHGHILVMRAEGTTRTLESVFPLIQKATAPHSLTRLPDRAISPTRRVLSVVMKIAVQAWPDANLSERIASLPPSIRTYIDPDSLW